MRLGDYWTGQLSIRELAVLVEHLPPRGSLWAAELGLPTGWTFTDLLLTDLFGALTGKEHPGRPDMSHLKERAKREEANARVAALLEQRKRIARQRAEAAAKNPPS